MAEVGPSVADERLRTLFGAAVLGCILADCLHTVRSGAVPAYDLPLSWALAIGSALAAVAIWARASTVRFAGLSGLAFVLLASTSAVSSSVRGRAAALTCLFTMGTLLLAETATSRAAVLTVAAAALGAGVVRWATLAWSHI
jgi:hypothetical protein